MNPCAQFIGFNYYISKDFLYLKNMTKKYYTQEEIEIAIDEIFGQPLVVREY